MAGSELSTTQRAAVNVIKAWIAQHAPANEHPFEVAAILELAFEQIRLGAPLAIVAIATRELLEEFNWLRDAGDGRLSAGKKVA
jgi:hypothetical protein